jgi:hypothetical protein
MQPLITKFLNMNQDFLKIKMNKKIKNKSDLKSLESGSLKLIKSLNNKLIM